MTVIIVLGNANKEIMEKRIDRALSFFNSTKDKDCFSEYTWKMEISTHILMCGGTKGCGLASTMKKYAVSQGIDEKFIMMESESKTTVENLSNARNILNKFSYKPHVIVCTSSFHLKRSAVITKFLFNDYMTEFIHTEETPSEEEVKVEKKHLDKFLVSILSLNF